MNSDFVPADRLLSQVQALRLRPLHILIVILCGLGFMFDIADLNLSNVLSAVFSAGPHPQPPGKLAWLLAAPYVGGVPGALVFGWVADRLGRRTALLGMLGVLGVTSILAAGARDIESLTWLRIAAGLTIGSFPPILMAFLSDHVPADHRGGLLMLASALGLAGAPLCIFFIRWLGPARPFGLDAWRLAFLIYGAASLVVAVALSFMPEAVRWLAKSGQTERAARTLARLAGGQDVVAVPASPQPVTATAPLGMTRWHYFLSILFNLVTPWATVAFPVLSGAMLVQKGVKLPDALLYVGIAAIAPILGMVAGAFRIDAWGRRPVLWVSGSVMILCVLAFVFGKGAPVLIAAGFIFQMATSLFIPISSIYFAEQFPTATRARATAALWAINRFGAVMAPLALLPLLHSHGPLPLAVLIGATLLSGMGLLWIMPPGRARQELR